MADSTPNILLTENAWNNLYVLSGIPVGTQIIVTNVGDIDIRLYAAATFPISSEEGIPLEKKKQAINEAGDSGAWAYCPQPVLVNVREA